MAAASPPGLSCRNGGEHLNFQMSLQLSIVIIGRNEQQGLAECISAARSAANEAESAEILYVDSASTDASVAIAGSMGARVLEMRPEWKLCPSAGRYVGSRHAGGEYVLFLDADTHVYKGFVPAAIRQFQASPEVAGINGRIDDLNENGETLTDVEDRFDEITDVKWLRGPACFYRRSALLSVGSFDPHLAMEEEAELGLRLLKAGWKLQLMPVPMACHTRFYHCQTFASVASTFRRDVETGRLGEITRTIAAAFRNGYGMAFCWLRLKTTIQLTVWLAVLLAILIVPLPVAQAAAFVVVLLAGMISIYLKKGTVKLAVLFVINKLLIIVDVLAGIPKLFDAGRDATPFDLNEFESERAASQPR